MNGGTITSVITVLSKNNNANVYNFINPIFKAIII